MSKQTKIIAASVATAGIVAIALVVTLLASTSSGAANGRHHKGAAHAAASSAAASRSAAEASWAADRASRAAASSSAASAATSSSASKSAAPAAAAPTATRTVAAGTPVNPPTAKAPTPVGSTSSTASSTSAGVPAACANNGPYVWANLPACGWPNASNTGAVASSCPGGVLTNNSGSLSRTITVKTSISCQNITGCLSIQAQNVSITNVKVTCNSGKTGENANGTGAIYVDDGASATISHVEINGSSGVHACIWDQGTALTVNYVNCYGINDGIFSWADLGYSSTTGDHFSIQNSYFHDFTAKTANGHIDGYQTEGAAHGLINHNTYLMTSDDGNSSDSAIAIWNSLKNSSDITVSNNLIAGGGFSIYAQDYSDSYSVTNIRFANNQFSTHLFGCVGDYGVWFTRGNPTDTWNRSGNTVLETGQNIDNGNPVNKGQLCT